MKPQKSLTGDRMFWTWIQILVDIVTALAFLFYGIFVENKEPCFSDGVGAGRKMPHEDDTDVAHAFKVVIYGFAGLNIADVLIRVARIFIPKIKTIMVFLMFLNFLIMIGFFIAIHIVRFRASG